MMFIILGIGLLPILFRLALKLRLGIPMLYVVLMLTVFHSWYQANVGEIIDDEANYYGVVSMLTAMPIDTMVQLGLV